MHDSARGPVFFRHLAVAALAALLGLAAFRAFHPGIEFAVLPEHLAYAEGTVRFVPRLRDLRPREKGRGIDAALSRYVLGRRFNLAFFENGRPLRPAAAAAEVGGGGWYACAGESLYFSSSDGSDPVTNGRAYSVRVFFPVTNGTLAAIAALVAVLAELYWRKTGILIRTEAVSPVRPARTYRPDIDGLRCVAVLSVVGYHYAPSLAPGGFVGVDVFFVISGFLISGVVLSGLEEGTFTLADFYSRRVRRIFPALAVVLAACFAAGWVALVSPEFRLLGKHMAAGAGFVSNLVLWSEAGYFDASSSEKALLHLWSLGIEEQFYIVLPLLMAALWRWRLNHSAALVMLFFASFILNARSVPSTAAYYSPADRGWELLAGCLLACFAGTQLPPRLERARRRLAGPFAANACSLCGLAMVAAPVALYGHGTPFPGMAAVLPVAGACLLIRAGPDTAVNRLLLANRPMAWIGLISFSLYLWHWPVWYFFRALFETPLTAAQTLAAAGLTFVMAWATYRFVETPVRRHRRGTAAAVFCVAAMTAAGTAGYAAYRLGGLPFRLPEYESQWKELAFSSYSRMEDSWLRRPGPGDDSSFMQSAPGRPDILVIGDSHAHSLAYGLGNALKGRGDGIVVAETETFGMPPFFDLLYRGAATLPQRHQRYVRDFALAEEGVETVVLACFWGAPRYESLDGGISLEGFDVPEGLSPGEKAEKVYAEGLRRTLAFFTALNKRVVFVVDTPTLPRPAKEYLDRPFKKSPLPPWMPRREYEEQKEAYMKALRPVLDEFPGVEVFDPTSLFCDGERCLVIKDGALLFADANHLSEDGVRLVAGALAAMLEGGGVNSQFIRYNQKRGADFF